MKFFQIVFFFIAIIWPSIHCMFIRNPLNWFRNQPKAPENETLSVNPFVETMTLSTTQVIEAISPTNSRLPLFPQPLESSLAFSPPDRQREPLSLAQLGVPIKTNRFGLDPLHYPFKLTPSKFHAIHPQNSLSNLQLNRRIGELLESSTRRLVMNETQDVVNKEVNNTLDDKPSTDNSMHNISLKTDGKEIENSRNDSKLEIEEMMTTSPTPVYKSVSTTDSTEEVIASTITPKPIYLHNQEFAQMLNNMYYNNPMEMFAPMMDRFDPKSSS
ncbi:unnamed protein product [Oppiella nova]|uniref:Uncharacterized protein n=1 Tax=Oppiella nova TaxID=334625 RepID=A0A7R9LKW8_9ACAR|nr:unnamed protein product [Oppiella nova]CAG2164658.1 unnamed protein product [Oppiella nova]